MADQTPTQPEVDKAAQQLGQLGSDFNKAVDPVSKENADNKLLDDVRALEINPQLLKAVTARFQQSDSNLGPIQIVGGKDGQPEKLYVIGGKDSVYNDSLTILTPAQRQIEDKLVDAIIKGDKEVVAQTAAQLGKLVDPVNDDNQVDQDVAIDRVNKELKERGSDLQLVYVKSGIFAGVAGKDGTIEYKTTADGKVEHWYSLD